MRRATDVGCAVQALQNALRRIYPPFSWRRSEANDFRHAGISGCPALSGRKTLQGERAMITHVDKNRRNLSTRFGKHPRALHMRSSRTMPRHAGGRIIDERIRRWLFLGVRRRGRHRTKRFCPALFHGRPDRAIPIAESFFARLRQSIVTIDFWDGKAGTRYLFFQVTRW